MQLVRKIKEAVLRHLMITMSVCDQLKMKCVFLSVTAEDDVHGDVCVCLVLLLNTSPFINQKVTCTEWLVCSPGNELIIE